MNKYTKQNYTLKTSSYCTEPDGYIVLNSIYCFYHVVINRLTELVCNDHNK